MKINCFGDDTNKNPKCITIILKAMDLSFMANKIVQSYILSSL